MPPSERSPDSPANARETRKRRPWTALLLLALPGLVLAVLYAPALDYDFVWTDTSAIAGRSMLRPADEIAQAWSEPLHRIAHRGDFARQSYYRPLQVVLLSWVDARVGSQPRDFRSAGLIVGALCLGVFALLAWRLLGQPAAAGLAAVFVACHPVGIECYVWIAGVSGPLCSGFVLISIAFALVATQARSSATFAGLTAASLLALTAGLMSKERALVAPALLAATLLLQSRPATGLATGNESGGAHARTRGAGLVAAQLGLALAYWFAWRPRVLDSATASMPPLGDSTATQLLSAVANWPEKFAWLFFPLHSSTSDVIRVVDSPADARFLLGLGLVAATAVAGLLCLRAGRPIAALGIAWIWIAYLPTAGLQPMLHANGERYWFLSAFGAALVVADLASALARRTGRVPATVVALALLAFLSERTLARLPLWESNLRLFENEIARDPAYREGWFLVAAEQYQRGRLHKADRAITTLLADGPEFAGTASYSNPLSVSELACTTKLALHEYDEILEFERDIERRHPRVLRAAPLKTCIGQAHIALGNTSVALATFEAVERELGPNTPPGLYLKIARAHQLLGRSDAARAWVGRARAGAGPDHALLAQIVKFERSLPPPPAPITSQP
jgi:tetratricopeptide (TPR) repeat protein